jgi:hypothetical protein
VFTTHPKNEPIAGTRWPDHDGYWTGTGSLPRSAQHVTAAIHLYAPQFVPPGPPLDAYGYLPCTHAYFPQEHFDEVVRDGHWTIGRKGDGYVALWSWRAVHWHTYDDPAIFTHGLTEPFDLRADGGADNVWVVEVGDATRWGTFDAFAGAITAATIAVEAAVAVEYHSPAQGVMTFGWEGPLRVDGTEIELHPTARFDNPWARVEFGERRYELRDPTTGSTLRLDFDADERRVS